MSKATKVFIVFMVASLLVSSAFAAEKVFQASLTPNVAIPDNTEKRSKWFSNFPDEPAPVMILINRRIQD